MERFKPEANDLTNYYFLTSLGSVLGSAFVSLIIPLIFSDYWDLSLLAALSCLAVLALNFKLLNNNRLKISAFISTILVISLGIFFSINTFLKYDYISRNYYGVLKIKTVLNQEKNLSYKMLQNNNINHGIQYLDPIYSQIPTSYYNEYSGLGLVNKIIDSKQSTKKLGMIGLGAGTVASYCRQGDKCGIYEIDNQVINIAENQFTYLSDARKRGVDVQTYLGDGRNVIESQTNDYDLLGVDAFSGDSIPSHLFTDNAIKIFSKQIKSDGYLAFHTSNRYFNLAPILARLALENNFQTFQVNYKGKGEDESSNSWVILTKKLIPTEDYPDYQIKELKSDINQTFWTDDYNSLMHIWIGINKKLF